MYQKIASQFVVVLVVLTVTERALAVPEPSEVPRSWELRFRFVEPQRISVRLPTEQGPRTFWYLLYTVENDSGRTVQFLPTFELVTDTNQVIRAQTGVHPVVYDAIKQRHRKTHPFMAEPVRMLGPLLHGEEHARDSVAIWPEFDPEVSSFTIYVGGLSGESHQIVNPLYDPAKPQVAREELPDGSSLEKVVNPKYFTLRKTLALKYVLPGNEQSRRWAKPKREGRDWVMR